MQTNMVLCAFIIIIICTDESSKNYARNMEREREKRGIKLTIAWQKETLKAFKVEYWKLGGTTSVIIIILVLSIVRHAHIFFFRKIWCFEPSSGSLVRSIFQLHHSLPTNLICLHLPPCKRLNVFRFWNPSIGTHATQKRYFE